GAPRRHEDVPEAVAPAPRDATRSANRLERGPARGVLERLQARVRDARPLQARDGGDASAPPVPPPSLAARSRDEVAQGRQADDPHDGLARGVLETDHDPVERHSLDEGLGPVDGVDDPAETGRPRPLAALLAEERVPGELARE